MAVGELRFPQLEDGLPGHGYVVRMGPPFISHGVKGHLEGEQLYLGDSN